MCDFCQSLYALKHQRQKGLIRARQRVIYVAQAFVQSAVGQASLGVQNADVVNGAHFVLLGIKAKRVRRGRLLATGEAGKRGHSFLQ